MSRFCLRRTKVQNAKLQEGITSVQSLGEVELSITVVSVALGTSAEGSEQAL